MPNHIINRLRFDADDKTVKEMLEKIKQDEFGVGSIDFNKIIPMPDDIFRGNLGSAERELYRDSNMISWRVDCWATKYNSYGYECMTQPFEGNEITFFTAWSAPTPVIEKLSEMFPGVEIEHLWADEDFGYNCGAVTWRGGEQIFLDIPTGGTKEAFELAAEIMDYDITDCGLFLNADESNYIYLDSDEYGLIEFFGEPALFTNDKLSNSDIPKGLFCYHLRENDNGDGFSTVEPYVKVNHGGSIITKTPLDFGEQGYIEFDEETSPNFLGEDVSIKDYMENSFEQEVGMSLE